MTILNAGGQPVSTKKTLDDLPIMTCQAMRPKSIEEPKVIIKCGGQVFLLGMAYKLDEDGEISDKKNTAYPQQLEVCSTCGALNSKGIDKEANAFAEVGAKERRVNQINKLKEKGDKK